MRKLVGFVLGLGLVAMAFAGLALAVVVGVATALALAVTSLFVHRQPEMAYARVKPNPGQTGQHRHTQAYRVWNDGRGTIIDM